MRVCLSFLFVACYIKPQRGDLMVGTMDDLKLCAKGKITKDCKLSGTRMREVVGAVCHSCLNLDSLD